MKRALTLILAAAMLLTLAACGGASAQAKPDPAEAPVMLMPLSAAAEPAEEGGEEAPEEPAPTPAPEYRLTSASVRFADEMWAQYDYTFSYDGSGYLPTSFQRTVLDGGEETTVTIVYDDAGRITAKDDSDGAHAEYTYDEDGNTTYTFFGHVAEDGTVTTESETTQVFEDGRLVEEIWSATFYINEKSIPGTCTVEYNYDEAGNMIRSDMDYAYEDGTTSTASYEYEYDDHGKSIRDAYISTDADGNEFSFEAVSTFAYDEHGNVIHEERTQTDQAGGSITTVYDTEYTYDDAGNILSEKSTVTSDDSGYSSGAYHLPLLTVQWWEDSLTVMLLDSAGHSVFDMNNNRLYSIDDAELTYDDNGYLTRIDDGAGSYMEFTYGPVA